MIVLGDESGYTDGEVQQVKLAAIEAEWETEPPPASFTVIGLPDQEKMRTDYAVKIPWVLGLIGTRSFDEPIIGLKDFLERNDQRVRNGMLAYQALQDLREGPTDQLTLDRFERYKKDLGYGLLLKRYTEKVTDASEAQIAMAVKDTIPPVAPLFWTFRIMVACGFVSLVVFTLAFVASSFRHCSRPWLLKLAIAAMPLPWIACEMGWFVAEFGRQPWTIAEILPTFLSASSLTESDLIISLSGYIGLYTLFLIIEVFLMLKFIRLGPSALHKGHYHFEVIAGEAR